MRRCSQSSLALVANLMPLNTHLGCKSVPMKKAKTTLVVEPVNVLHTKTQWKSGIGRSTGDVNECRESFRGHFVIAFGDRDPPVHLHGAVLTVIFNDG